MRRQSATSSASALRSCRSRGTRTTSQARPGLLERPDHRRRRVDLPAPHAVRGRGREGVVVVVPRLAERQRREPGEVARLVAGVEALAAEEVAQRVDAVGHVVQHAACRTSPPHSRPVSAANERAADQPAERRTAARGRRAPSRGTSARPSGPRGPRCRSRRVALLCAALGVDEEPADVRVQQARAARRGSRRRGRRAGECGSPSWSEKAWCLRWSATHEMTGPSIATEPRRRTSPRTHGFVLKRGG